MRNKSRSRVSLRVLHPSTLATTQSTASVATTTTTTTARKIPRHSISLIRFSRIETLLVTTASTATAAAATTTTKMNL